MGTMGYVLFENTFGDFEECIAKLEGRDSLNELSESERAYAKRIYDLLADYESAFIAAEEKADDEDEESR